MTKKVNIIEQTRKEILVSVEEVKNKVSNVRSGVSRKEIEEMVREEFEEKQRIEERKFKAVLLLWIVFVRHMLHVGVCCNAVSVLCSLVVICWERADLLAVVFVVFCHFPKCVLVHIRIKGEVDAVKLV